MTRDEEEAILIKTERQLVGLHFGQDPESVAIEYTLEKVIPSRGITGLTPKMMFTWMDEMYWKGMDCITFLDWASAFFRSRFDEDFSVREQAVHLAKRCTHRIICPAHLFYGDIAQWTMKRAC